MNFMVAGKAILQPPISLPTESVILRWVWPCYLAADSLRARGRLIRVHPGRDGKNPQPIAIRGDSRPMRGF